MITRDEILNLLKSEHVSYLRLCFTDIMGISKNVEISASQFPRALDGQVLFDGSSIEGFARIEESDMVLVPDYNTFHLLPWDNHGGHKIARIICDIANIYATKSAILIIPSIILNKIGFFSSVNPIRFVKK